MADRPAAEEATPSKPSKAGGRKAGPDGASMGLPHFCRARHWVRGANVFVVPVWDLPSRWCPEEVKSSASGAPATAAASTSSPRKQDAADTGDQGANGEEAKDRDDNLDDDDEKSDSGSDSEQSEIGWDVALDGSDRVWSRAALNNALILLRRVQAPKAEGDEAAEQAAFGIGLSSALFHPDAITGADVVLDKRLADVVKDRSPKWAVCALRSGHFAGAVFHGTEPVVHKAIHRYTIRAKSGGAQSAQDSSKKTKSAGSTLRRYGQTRLAEEIQELLTDKWKAELDSCDLIFTSVSKRMRTTLLGSESKPYVPSSKVRKLPFMVGKPTFEAIKEAHVRVAGVVFADEATAEVLERPFRPKPVADASKQEAAFSPPAREAQSEKAPAEKAKSVKYKEEDDELFSELHKAAANGDEDRINELLDEGADPTARDGKGRVPYFLCANQRTREAFRRWRGRDDNEDKWDWNAGSVPDAITEDSEQKKKDKEKAKKQKQKEKQKANKAAGKEEEEARKKKEAEEAAALAAAQTKCDSCKVPITGKPFSSNNFYYCSTDCVVAHRRQLQAEAAMKRFG